MSVSILKEKCIRCGACMDECPEGAICYGENNIPYVIEEDCNECGVCCSVCCSEALSV